MGALALIEGCFESVRSVCTGIFEKEPRAGIRRVDWHRLGCCRKREAAVGRLGHGKPVTFEADASFDGAAMTSYWTHR